MKHLDENQSKLVTVLDIHSLLKHISTPSEPASSSQGLIGEISSDRECSDLPLYQPNICICAEKG